MEEVEVEAEVEEVPQLLELPSSVISYILSFLHFQDVMSFGYLSKGCYAVAESDLTWVFLYKRDYSTVQPQLPLSNVSPPVVPTPESSSNNTNSENNNNTKKNNNNNKLWKQQYFRSKMGRRERVLQKIKESKIRQGYVSNWVHTPNHLKEIVTSVPVIPATCGN